MSLEDELIKLLVQCDGVLGLCRHREQVSEQTRRDIDEVRREIYPYTRRRMGDAQ